MKSTLEFLARLRSLHVHLSLTENSLRCDAPEGVMTDELQAELRYHKASLIPVLQSAQGSEGQTTQLIQPILRDSKLPLSFAQQRFWFLDRLEPGNIAYQIVEAIQITGILNIKALDKTLQEIVRRHEVLRTRFPSVDGVPTPIIDPTSSWKGAVKDLRDHPELDHTSLIQKILVTESHQPFDLAAEPLFRTQLLRLTDLTHVLVLTIHHIVWDGWSFGVLMDEMGKLYNTFHNGQQSSLVELPIQYADYAVWQRQWLQGDVLNTQLQYWRQQLAGEIPTLTLPTDRPRPRKQTFQGARHPIAIPRKVKANLLSVNQHEGTTLFMTLLAAFQVLLVRYAGQEDLLIGCPIANRTRLEAENLIGPFANTLVLRTDCSENPRFRELLGRVKETALGAFCHQDIPFELLVEKLQIPRELSYTPLFQVMFVYQNVPMGELDSPGLTFTPVEIPGNTAMFDLTVSLWDAENGEVRGTVDYNTDLFEAETIKRWFEHFNRIIVEVGRDPEQRIGEIPILTPAEFPQMIEQKHEREDFQETSCLHELFEAQVIQTPDAVALVYEDHTLTYRELNQRANHVAHMLRGMGVGPEHLVGLCVERSLAMIVGVLGILKAGGAYVPMDPTNPKGRLRFILEDTGAKVLVTQERLISQWGWYSGRVICLDGEDLKKQAAPLTNPHCAANSSHLAYVIYTSGSTGTPKGVMVTHNNVLRLLRCTEIHFRFCERDNWTLFHSIAFDVSVWELWGALLYGGRLVIVSFEVTRTPESFVRLLQQEQITVLGQTPSAFQQLLQVKSVHEGTSWALRLIIFAGEALNLESLIPWVECYGDQFPTLVNMYGITETTVHSTVQLLQKEVIQHFAGSRIGEPLADLEIFLLDKHLNPVPTGVPGEMYVGGKGVARGYLHRPDLTATRFVPHLFNHTPGDHLYRSGDLAKRMQDGSLEYLRRIDDQVKVRGYRIELGEIENTLQEHQQIDAVKVIVREDKPGDKRIVAYMVTANQSHIDVNDLKQFTRERIPDYMVPSAFVRLDQFPLTMNGKIDKRALPSPHDHEVISKRQYVAPQNELELTISRVWQQVLGIKQIGINDNFFDLGGNSMLAVQVHQQLCNGLKVQFPMVGLFQYPTISTIAQYLRQDEQLPQNSLQATANRAHRQNKSFSGAKFRQEKNA